MAFTHGKDAKFKVDDSGDVLRDLSTYLTSANLTRSADLADASTLGATYKGFVAGLIDARIPIEGNYDPVIDGYLTGIFQLSKDFEYYPAGEPVGATKPKFSGKVILVTYDITTGIDGTATISGEFQVDGAVTRAVA